MIVDDVYYTRIDSTEFLVWTNGLKTFSMSSSNGRQSLIYETASLEKLLKVYKMLPPYCLLSWLSCADCGNISFLDYLCKNCRNGMI